MNIHESYDLKQRNIAELVAFFKNSVMYEDGRKLFIVNSETLNERINQLLAEKKFMSANGLIKSAKNGFENEDIISAEFVSKSLRLPFPVFYKFLVIAENEEMSLADVIRKLTVPRLKLSLNQIEQFPNFDKKKVEKLREILTEWEHKKNTKYYSINDTGYYIGKGRRYVGDLSNMITFDIDTLLMKYLQILVSSVLSKHKLPNAIAQVYAESYMDEKRWINNGNVYSEFCNPFIKRFEATFKCVNTHLNIGLSSEYKDIDNPDLDDFSDTEIINTFGEEIWGKFFNLLQDYGIEFGIIELGNYDVVLDGKHILINGISPLDKASFQKTVYDKLNTECLFISSFNSQLNDSESNSLIDSDFNEDIYNNHLQQAISEGDYETASKYSETLQIHQILSELSSSICDVLNKIIRDSRVVTFTIPRTLMTLLDLTREDDSLRTFVVNELDEYWGAMGETGVK